MANRPGPLGDARILVVYDLEFTSWPGFLEAGFKAPGKYPEIVEIGALRVDRRHGYRELDAFACYVRPRINPDLSGYFTRLTGITQQMVARDGLECADAIARFAAFVAEALPVCHGGDNEVVALNCQLNGLEVPENLAGGVDIRPAIARAMGHREADMDSSGLPARLGIATAGGRAHSGLHDARCVAAALAHLEERGML